jgi:hypothetical protein
MKYQEFFYNEGVSTVVVDDVRVFWDNNKHCKITDSTFIKNLMTRYNHYVERRDKEEIEEEIAVNQSMEAQLQNRKENKVDEMIEKIKSIMKEYNCVLVENDYGDYGIEYNLSVNGFEIDISELE